MNLRKAVVPKPISIRIGEFPLSRTVKNRLLAAIHADSPKDFPQSRHFRLPGNDLYYRYRIAITEGERSFSFTLAIDDTTTAEHLIVVGIRYDEQATPE
jgi:hypothetical protein